MNTFSGAYRNILVVTVDQKLKYINQQYCAYNGRWDTGYLTARGTLASTHKTQIRIVREYSTTETASFGARSSQLQQ